MIFNKLTKMPLKAMRDFQVDLCKKINTENQDVFVFPNLWPEEIFCRIDDVSGEFIPAVVYLSKSEQKKIKIIVDNGLLKNSKLKRFDTFKSNEIFKNPLEETFLVVMDQNKNIYSCMKRNDKFNLKNIFLCFGNIEKRNVLWFEEDNLCLDYGSIKNKSNVMDKKIFYNTYQPKKIKKYNTRQLLIQEGFATKILKKENELPKAELRHSSLLGGRPASFAGEITCRNGKPCLINNISGHYRTKPCFLNSFVEHLKSLGVNLNYCEINLRKDEII